MKIVEAGISGLYIIEPDVFCDERGSFFESFNLKKFNEIIGDDVCFVQDNHSHSKKNVLRGMHFQIEPHAQGKLVRVVQGSVYDVAVDLRKGSTTFGKWVGIEINQSNRRQFWVPAGFAHGFIVLSESADFLYKTTNYYSPEHERSLLWNDPLIGIDWPVSNPILSEKDERAFSYEMLNMEEL